MQVNGNTQSSLYQLLNQRKTSMQDMVQDVQSGNITGAQAALAQMQQANQSLGINGGTTSGSSPDASASGSKATAGLSSMKNDLTAMMSAVQSGDLTSAQNAWNQIQSNMAVGMTQDTPSPPPPAYSNDSTTGAATDDLTKLLDAVQSGDTDGMKTSATAFAKDLQNLLGSTSSTSTAAASTSTDSTGNPILDDLNALVQAAQSGDANAAQTAQQKLQNDMQATEQASGTGHAHGHHHHRGGGGKPEAIQSTSATTATPVLAADGASPDSTATTTTSVDTIPA